MQEAPEPEAATAPEETLESAVARNRERGRARLRQMLADRRVRDALCIASPSLVASLLGWEADPESRRGQATERALVRYLTRMSSRPTPFGLFAGTGAGVVGERTSIRLDPPEKHRRRSRLDAGYLDALARSLGADSALREQLVLRPGPGLYKAGGELRVIEALQGSGGRSFRLVAIEEDEALRHTLALAEQGLRGGELVARLAEALQVEPEEARAWVEALLDAQVLALDLGGPLTGDDALGTLAAQLQAAGSPAGPALEAVARRLAGVDAGEGDLEGLESLPGAEEAGRSGRLVQVDLALSGQLTLGRAVEAEIRCGVELLQRLAPFREDPALVRFREAFRERWGEAELPLLDVLDEESGIGFGRSEAPSAAGEPLLEGLPLGRPAAPALPAFDSRAAYLLRRLVQDPRMPVLTLDEAGLQALSQPAPAPLPDAVSALAVVAAASAEAIDAGDFQVQIRAVGGPSGAYLLGRFCHLDPALEQGVRAHLQAEEELRPDAVFAEIVHLPEGRIGNVLQRPVLRGYEIPFLGRSGAPADRQIPLSDLRVSVQGDRVVLRSIRLDREVIPRLSAAFNPHHPTSQGMHRFLCALQFQGVAGDLSWSWGPLSALPYLPRVVAGRLVLALARWKIDGTRLSGLAAEQPVGRLRAARALRQELDLPQRLVLVDGDNLLPIDLEDSLSVDALARLVAGRPEIVLQERFPEQAWVEGAQGRHAHELVLPFVRSGPPTVPARPRVYPPLRHPPGSEWLYAKLYAGPAGVDRLLRQVVRPVVQQALESGAARGWFFIRYGDPDWHLRLRLRGVPARLMAEVLPALSARAQEAGLERLQLDTYIPELARYGGPEALAECERLFEADSEAVLSLLDILPESEAGLRWRLCLAGMSRLLDDLQLDPQQRLVVLTQARDSFAAEHGLADPGPLSPRYRAERSTIERTLSGAGLPEPALAALDQRSLRSIEPVKALLALEKEQPGLRAQLAGSLLHMHANRLLRSAARAQELVLYEFLLRSLRSAAARHHGSRQPARAEAAR